MKMEVLMTSSAHRTSTEDCLRTCIRVGRLGDNELGDGTYGKKAASDAPEETNTRWNGIGSCIQNTLDAGIYSYGRRIQYHVCAR